MKLNRHFIPFIHAAVGQAEHPVHSRGSGCGIRTAKRLYVGCIPVDQDLGCDVGCPGAGVNVYIALFLASGQGKFQAIAFSGKD